MLPDTIMSHIFFEDHRLFISTNALWNKAKELPFFQKQSDIFFSPLRNSRKLVSKYAFSKHTQREIMQIQYRDKGWIYKRGSDNSLLSMKMMFTIKAKWCDLLVSACCQLSLSKPLCPPGTQAKPSADSQSDHARMFPAHQLQFSAVCAKKSLA